MRPNLGHDDIHLIRFSIPHECESGGSLYLKLEPGDFKTSGTQTRFSRMRRARIYVFTRVILFSRGVYPSWVGYLVLFLRGRNAQTFQEKIARSLTFPRNRSYRIFGDKIEVKKFIENRAGAKYLPKIYSIWTPGESVDWGAVPREFVAKSTHGIGGSLIVREKSDSMSLSAPTKGDDWRIVHSTPAGLDKSLAETYFRKWSKQNYAKKIDEYPQWFYGPVKPRVIFEELLVTSTGEIPTDYKFLCFNGKCQLVLRESNRFSELQVDLFDPQGGHVEGTLAQLRNSPQKVNLPDNFQEMIQLSEKLAEGFNFVSVDMYSIEGRIVIGELAVVAALGSLFSPPVLEEWLGSLWKLPAHGAKRIR